MSCDSHHSLILSFPAELLEEISKYIPKLLTLRLVCRTFNDVFTPQVFSQISIAFKDNKPGQFLEVLESLAEDTHPAIPHARSLTIGHLIPSQGHRFNVDEHSEVIRKWISLGLKRLSKVTSVTWAIDGYRSHDWSNDCIVSAISQMTSITDFELTVNRYEKDGPAQPLRGVQSSGLPPLQKLSVNAGYRTSICPNGSIQELPELIEKSSGHLRELRVSSQDNYSGGGETPLLSYLLQKVQRLHLKHLSLNHFDVIMDEKDVDKLLSLDMLCKNTTSHALDYLSYHDDDEPKRIARFWYLLKDRNLHLKEITISEPDNNFMDYLRSYSGLRSLTISRARYTSQKESDRYATKFYSGGLTNFYQGALIRHSESLQKLAITPEYESKWSFGEHCDKTLCSLSNLQHLSMSINADTYVDLKGSHYDPSHPVCQLLRMASSLPKLELLSIHGAILDAYRLVECGNGRAYDRNIHPNIRIDTHVTSFGPVDPSEYRFTVETSCGYLRPRMIEDIREYRFRLIES